MRFIKTFALAFVLVAQGAAKDFTLTIVHVNDTHARIEPTMIQGKPYGGMARLGTLIEHYRKADPNVLVLHGGDAFQGTIYFNVYEGLADEAFLNAMHLDAMAVGNHEFDKGPAVLGRFVENAQFPVLSANVDVTHEPALEGRIKSSVVVSRGGERIGIVGATTVQLLNISNTGPNVQMRDLAASVQAEVDKLTRAGINKIILLTHVGYEPEQELARTIHGVDIVVGGHSHTLLGDAKALSLPGFPAPAGPYPTVVDNVDGGKALVVQSWEGERVLGHMQVTFDGKGHIKRWTNAAPIVVDEKVAEEPELRALVAAFQKPIVEQRDRKIAVASVGLGRDNGVLGEIITDAMKQAAAKQNPVVAFLNPGSVRASVEPGNITFGNAITVQPFNNTLVVMDLTGAQLMNLLDESLRPLWVSDGMRYSFDGARPAGSRIRNLTLNGVPVSPTATYRVVVSNFMAGGGDGLSTLKASTGYRYDTGLLDLDAFTDYLASHSPVSPAAERRVQILSPMPAERN